MLEDTFTQINDDLKELIRVEEDFGLGYKKLSKDEQIFVHFQLEVIRTRVNQLFDLLIKD